MSVPSDSEDVSEQRAFGFLPNSVPIESEGERAAREEYEMAALDAVGNYEADPTVMQEDVFKTLFSRLSRCRVHVLLSWCLRVCVCACARRQYVIVRICICNFCILCLCVRVQRGKHWHRTQIREWMGDWSDQGL
jgi:hypothetical protein